MRICATCGREGAPSEPRCPVDGGLLVETAGPGARPMGRPTAQATVQVAIAPELTEDLEPGAMVGEYRIEGKIGVGGMGVVYGARHPVIGKRAAIKVLNRKYSADHEAVERFVFEAQAVNQIGHANIIDIFSFGTLPDGRSFFAMEWLSGDTLEARIGQGELPIAELLSILITLTRALEAAHAAGVVHRDLKPDNIFLVAAEDPTVKLLDFGIAKLSSTEVGRSRTATGMVVGTPLYMSPEQAKGERVDARSDIYSLGVVAYAMACNQTPFEREGSAVEILSAHITKPPQPPTELRPDLAPALASVILEMLAKDPEHRPALADVRHRLKLIASADAAITSPTQLAAAVRAGNASPRSAHATAAAAAAADDDSDDDLVPRRRRSLMLPLAAVAAIGMSVVLFVAVRSSGSAVRSSGSSVRSSESSVRLSGPSVRSSGPSVPSSGSSVPSSGSSVPSSVPSVPPPAAASTQGTPPPPAVAPAPVPVAGKTTPVTAQPKRLPATGAAKGHVHLRPKPETDVDDAPDPFKP
jgi:eukaryotic-like serine/threonine-protein kinase